MTSRLLRYPVLVPVVAAVLAYLPALADRFVLDDDTLLVDNPYCRSLSGLRTMLTNGLFAASAEPLRVDYYRPASGLLYWTTYQLLGANPVAQHALNIAMHVAVVALVWATLRAFGVSTRVATGAATLFAVHPATADIVAYVGGRQDMLGWLFVLGGVLLLRRASSLPKVVAIAFVAVVLACFSREAFAFVAGVLPIACLGAEKTPPPVRRAAGALGGGVLGLGAVYAIRSKLAIGFAPVSHAHTAGDFIGTFASFSGRMLKDLVAPTDLVVYLLLPKVPAWVGFACAAAFLLVAWATLRALRDQPVPLRVLGIVGLCLIVGTTLVHTPVVVRSGMASDRYAYPFVLGAALWLGPLVQRAVQALGAREPSPLLRLAPALPYLLALAVVPATWARASAFRDEPTLQRRMYEDRPEDPNSKYAQATWLLARGDVEDAYPLCRAFAEAYPDGTQADVCIARYYFSHERFSEAIPYLRHHMEQHPNAGARAALFTALFATNDLDGVQSTLDEWPELASAPDAVAARKELERRRATGSAPR